MNARRALLAFVSAGAMLVIATGGAKSEVNPARALPAAVDDLSIAGLGTPPRDPGNRWADHPEAAALGHRLFFDARLSSDGRVSCATCHDPRIGFQDGIPLARGVGTTDRRTMPIAGTAHGPFLFWDGRKDSQWAQALGPLESPVEHGGTRAQYAHVIATHYRADYERRIQPGPSRFDRYVAAWKRDGAPPRGVLSADETAGLALFVGKANCTQCHNGPLLTNNEFHNTGVPRRPGLPADRGRIAAIEAVRSDEFNCRSRWSDAGPRECPELDHLAAASAHLERAYKVPSLRNVAERAPYMHAGQMATLAQVLRHYDEAPAAPAGTTELRPLGLSAAELRQLEAFLRTLSGGPENAQFMPAGARFVAFP